MKWPFRPCSVALGLTGGKLNSVLLKDSHVLLAFPWGDTNFHLIKVYDVSWDTKPDKLIHKSIAYYHKLLSERRLQLDLRQSMLCCSSSHSNIGDISIVTDSFSVFLAISLPLTDDLALDRTPPVLVLWERVNRPERSSSMKTVIWWHDEGEVLGLSRHGGWPQVVLSQLWSSTSVELFPSQSVCLTFFYPRTPFSTPLLSVVLAL